MGVNSPIMKIVYSLLIALVVLVLASCKKDSIHYADDFGDSRRAWQAFRDSAHNSYRYKVVSGSWVGTGLETIISVQAGKVVGRSFKYTARINNAPITTVREWVENESQLNSHQEGAKTITLDEVYQEAKNNWLKKGTMQTPISRQETMARSPRQVMFHTDAPTIALRVLPLR